MAVSIPDLSLVLPCYNEVDCLDTTVPALASAFRRAGIVVELVLVDNGSTDDTSAVIDRLIAQGLPITKGVVPVNRGQGLGIRTGFGLGRGRFIGYVVADGQIGAEDVVAVFRAARDAGRPVLAKARRRVRGDSWVRKLVSFAYNGAMQLVFLGLPSFDVNCNPKILPAGVLRSMELASSDWFLEAEIMLKADYLGLPVVEVSVLGRAREGGRSHVRASAVLEFLGNIVAYRAGGPWREWRRRVTAAPASELTVP